MYDDELKTIERRLREAQRELAEYKRRRAEQAVEEMSPEERRSLIRTWTHRLAGGGSAVIGGVEWLRTCRAPLLAAATSTAAAGVSWLVFDAGAPLAEPEPVIVTRPASTPTRAATRTDAARPAPVQPTTSKPSTPRTAAPTVLPTQAKRPPTHSVTRPIRTPTVKPTGAPSLPELPTLPVRLSKLPSVNTRLTVPALPTPPSVLEWSTPLLGVTPHPRLGRLAGGR